MLSPAVEDYLKTIYKLQTPGGGGVSTSDIARTMEVAPSSASNMVKRLAGLKLVEYRAYRGVVLTDAGQKIALEIIRHHRLLETYLREVMGFDWDQMHAEAEHLEHHISEEFEDKIEALLGYPTHDPHGDPIPSRDGVVPPVAAVPLSPEHVGERVEVVRLVEQDPALLRRFEQAGLLPGATLGVLATRPADEEGPSGEWEPANTNAVTVGNTGDETLDDSAHETEDSVASLVLVGPTGDVEEIAVDVARHLLVRIATAEATESRTD